MVNPVEWYKNDGWRVTSPYGPRSGKYAGFHRGVDFGGKPCGAEVRTPFKGKVVAAKTSGMGTWGNTVCIELGEYISLNAHLQTITVKEGQEVERGDVIGTNGGSNHSGPSYACHIHYEILDNSGSAPWRGQHQDPADFYQQPAEPSKKFHAGQTIQNVTDHNVNVRPEPGLFKPPTDRIEPKGKTVVKKHSNNGIKVGRYHWWRVAEGWVAEDFFSVWLPPEIKNLLERLLIKIKRMLGKEGLL